MVGRYSIASRREGNDVNQANEIASVDKLKRHGHHPTRRLSQRDGAAVHPLDGGGVRRLFAEQ
jgi:hypothetical protein